MSQPKVCRSRALCSSIALLQMNSFDIGVIGVQDDHLGGTGLAAALDGSGAGIGAAHEAQGPLAVPALLPKVSTLERIGLILMPEPEPPLKIMPSSTYQFRIAGISCASSIPRMKQALACWARSGAPMLNHGVAEGRPLRGQDIFELLAEVFRFGSRFFEVTLLETLAGDRIDDAVDQLLH